MRVLITKKQKELIRKIITEAVKVDVFYDTCKSAPEDLGMTPKSAPAVTTLIPVSVDDLPFVPPPADDSSEGQADLFRVLEQMSNPITAPEISEVYDKAPLELFKSYVESKGRSYNEGYYKILQKDLIPLIYEIKSVYNRLRPFQLADLLNIEIEKYSTDTTQTSSYPSGHAIQAYVVAIVLAHQFPDLTSGLLEVAELISQSRIDYGFHYQSDVIFGRMLASLIAKEILDEHFA